MMLSPFERMVAFRYLRARREEGLISVIALFSLIGIALGVATLIVTLAVMNGVRGEMIRSIIGLDGQVSVYATGAPGIASYDDVIRSIAAVPGVVSAVPKVEGQIMASYKGQAVGAMVAGYRYEDLLKKDLLVSRMTAGGLAAFGHGEGVLIGSRMAEKMGLHVGDDITLISPEGRATVAGMVPRVKAYKVAGIFSIGMYAYDNGLIVMPFEEAQVYFKLRDNGGDAATMIEVTGADADQAPRITREIAGALGPGFRVYDWKSSNNHIFQAVIVQRNVMFLILMLIIVVASFNIISGLIMLVREKGRGIAILRTMGASRGSILRIFLACGASVGLLGTLLGVALGLLIAFHTEEIQRWLESMMGHKLFTDELYFLSHLPSKVDFNEVLAVAALALALSFLATIYPARRAASLDPAEALRYE
ncbi:MAG: lipoprotein-releasing ABC transporter permease subunit [Pseudomonadota bacterium]|nr:lipoprotein-releasing ABC transporter permease subunit [Pseudomonadota bacterium]